MKSQSLLSIFLLVLFGMALFPSCQKETLTANPQQEKAGEQAILNEGYSIQNQTFRVRKHAPYLYLAKKTVTEYEMFIIVPVNDGEKITAGGFVDAEGSTAKKLDISIVNDPTVHQEYAVFNKTFSTSSTTTLNAIVAVDNPSSVDYSGKLELADATEDDVISEAGLAYCRPYAYLRRDASGNITPYALLPLKADMTATDNAPNGNVNCTHQISMLAQTPATQNRIVSSLNINGIGFSYLDGNPDISNGSFLVETGVSVNGLHVERGRTIIRNKNSDDK